jgi:hypothetical protein
VEFKEISDGPGVYPELKLIFSVLEVLCELETSSFVPDSTVFPLPSSWML